MALCWFGEHDQARAHARTSARAARKASSSAGVPTVTRRHPSSPGHVVRDCTTWPGLDGCLRVTVGTPAEDDAFLAALSEVLS